MIPLVVRRCVHAVTVLLLAVVGAFLLLHLLPGLPAAWIAGSDLRRPRLDWPSLLRR